MKDTLKLYYFLGYIPGLFVIIPIVIAFIRQGIVGLTPLENLPFVKGAVLFFLFGGTANAIFLSWYLSTWKRYSENATPVLLKTGKGGIIFSMTIFSIQALLLLGFAVCSAF